MKIVPTPILNYKACSIMPKIEQPGNNFAANSEQMPLNLPSVYPVGQSMVNANVSVPYTKLGEIAIPGLQNTACLYQLANGQKVIIAPKKGPTYIKTTYNVGSLNETENIRGISHFIEHNLFNGSKELAPREYDKRVSDLGAYTNASTGFSATDYYLKLQLLHDNSLENAIKLNAQQTQFPTFPIEQLEKEKEPVKSEIDMYKDMPSDVAASLVMKNLFNINTNSTNFILGTKNNINSFTREKVLDYFNTWYTPDNAVTVITGDVNPNETIELVSKYYNKRNDYSKIQQRHYEPVTYINKAVRNDIIQPNAPSASVTMGFAVPEGTSKAERDKLNLLMGILASTGSNLSKKLDKDGLSINIYTEHMQNKPDGAEAIIINVDAPEQQIEKVVKTLYEELIGISNLPPSQDELDNVKKKASNELKSVAETSSMLNSALTEMALSNNYNYFNDTLFNIQNTSIQDISLLARKFLDLNKVSMCVSHEKTSSPEKINSNYLASNFSNVSFGSANKPIDTVKEITSKVRQYKLPNNIETTVIQGNNCGKSALWFNLYSDELNNISSPAFMVMNEMLNRGSLYRSRDNLNMQLNKDDSTLLFSANQNGLDVIADFTDENINNISNLINEILLYPNFTESEFTRAKSVIKDLIMSEKVSAYDKLNKELYPELRIFDSKEERLNQLESLTLNDIKNAYSCILATSMAHGILTAPIEEKPYLQNYFTSSLANLPVFKPYTQQHSQNYNIFKPISQPKILVQEDEKAQAEIVQAYKFKNSQNINDIAKISLLNMILGGSMSSRLFTDLREDKKLAYHVSSNNSSEKDTATIELRIGTTTDSTDPKEGSPDNALKALEGFNRNINLLRTVNVSDKELENAKNRLKSKLLETMETNADLSSSIGNTKITPYGTDYYSNLFEAIEKTTAEDIKAAANHVFQNPAITSIVASKKTLNALGLS